MKRLVEWDALELRVNGEKVAAVAASVPIPRVVRLALHFSNGMLRVSGAVRKGITLPFTLEIRELIADGMRIRVPLKSATAFGGLPIPGWLVSLFKHQLPRELVTLEEPSTLVVTLDRFLPPFMDVEIRKIWIIDGGLAVTLGRGGADLPPEIEGELISHGVPDQQRTDLPGGVPAAAD
jgi:hypothetical protein